MGALQHWTETHNTLKSNLPRFLFRASWGPIVSRHFNEFQANYKVLKTQWNLLQWPASRGCNSLRPSMFAAASFNLSRLWQAEMLARSTFELTQNSLRASVGCTSTSLGSTSTSLRTHLGFTSKSLRFHSYVTSFPLRCHVELNSISLRYHFGVTSTSLRFQTDVTSLWLKCLVDFTSTVTSISLRFHWDFTSVSLSIHFAYTRKKGKRHAAKGKGGRLGTTKGKRKRPRTAFGMKSHLLTRPRARARETKRSPVWTHATNLRYFQALCQSTPFTNEPKATLDKTISLWNFRNGQCMIHRLCWVLLEPTAYWEGSWHNSS